MPERKAKTKKNKAPTTENSGMQANDEMEPTTVDDQPLITRRRGKVLLTTCHDAALLSHAGCNIVINTTIVTPDPTPISDANKEVAEKTTEVSTGENETTNPSPLPHVFLSPSKVSFKYFELYLSNSTFISFSG